MHELGIAQHILRIVEEHLEKSMRLLQVHLHVGQLRAIMPDSLRFYFNELTKDTPQAGAILDIEEIPVRTLCRSCGASHTLEVPLFLCPSCGSPQIETISGDELTVISVEVEEQENETLESH